MSRFTDAAKVFHSLTISAMEEASRTGERTPGWITCSLRSYSTNKLQGRFTGFGVTLEAARNAISNSMRNNLHHWEFMLTCRRLIILRFIMALHTPGGTPR